MKQIACLVLLGLVTLSICSPINKRQTLSLEDHPSIDPAAQDLSDLDDENRDKRKIESAVELKYGAKNAILGLIFNPAIDPNIPISYTSGTGAALPVAKVVLNRQQQEHHHHPTTTEDAVNFTPGQRVSLELPDAAFGSGFSLVTNVSKAAGNFIQNSAERTAKLFEAMKPFFRTFFGVDSLHVHRDVPHNTIDTNN